MPKTAWRWRGTRTLALPHRQNRRSNGRSTPLTTFCKDHTKPGEVHHRLTNWQLHQASPSTPTSTPSIPQHLPSAASTLPLSTSDSERTVGFRARAATPAAPPPHFYASRSLETGTLEQAGRAGQPITQPSRGMMSISPMSGLPGMPERGLGCVWGTDGTTGEGERECVMSSASTKCLPTAYHQSARLAPRAQCAQSELSEQKSHSLSGMFISP